MSAVAAFTTTAPGALLVASLTFATASLGTFLSEGYKRHRDRQTMAAALYGEIKNHSEGLNPGWIKILEDWKVTLAAEHQLPEYPALKVEDLIYKSFVDKLGLLPHEVIPEIVKFYQIVHGLRHALYLLTEDKINFNDKLTPIYVQKINFINQKIELVETCAAIGSLNILPRINSVLIERYIILLLSVPFRFFMSFLIVEKDNNKISHNNLGVFRPMPPEYEIEKYKFELQCELERYKSQLSKQAASDQSMAAIVGTLSPLALKSVFIVNAGSIIAILTFLGSFWSKDSQTASLVASKTIGSMEFFISGTIGSLSAMAFAYFSQVLFLEGQGKKWGWPVGNILRFAAIALAAGSIITFGVGSYQAAKAFAHASALPSHTIAR